MSEPTGGLATLPSQASIFQLNVQLKGISPPIWRRFQVAGNMTFHDLHLVLQQVMGWEDRHLYLFSAGELELSDTESASHFGGQNAAAVRLSDVLNEGSKFVYEYDMGDDWEHMIAVEAVLPAEPGHRAPCCLDGARACPPEDCGGVWGYTDLVEQGHQSTFAAHQAALRPPFDPEAFDLERVNDNLGRVFAGRR